MPSCRPSSADRLVEVLAVMNASQSSVCILFPVFTASSFCFQLLGESQPKRMTRLSA